jgi:Na+/melibiose symporter-like transporter
MAKTELSRWRLALFATPQIPIHALGLPFVVMLPPFYASEMGMGLVLVSQVFFLARMSDVFLDLGFGWLSDRLRLKWGRRRPWMLIGMPLMVFAVWRLFMPPASVTPTELLATLMVFYTGWTLVTLSHYAWGSELSDDYHQRSRIQGFKQIAIVGGITGVLLLTAMVERSGGTPLMQMNAMGTFAMILLPTTVLAVIFFVNERQAQIHPAMPAGLAFAAMRDNKPLRFVIAADLLVNFNAGLIGALFIFFARFYLGVGDQASALLFIYFLAGVIGIPIWTKIALQYGKRQCFIIHAVYNIVLLPLFFFMPSGQFWVAAIGFVLFGLNYGTSSIVLRAMMSDVIDVDKLRTGRDRSGLYFALLTLTAKVGLAAPLVIVYPVLSLIGFQAAGPNTTETIDILAAIYIFVPVVFNVLGILLMRRYPITAEIQAQMRAEIARKEATLGQTA